MELQRVKKKKKSRQDEDCEKKEASKHEFPVTKREKVHEWMWLSAGGGTLGFWGESKGGGWASMDRAITTH